MEYAKQKTPPVREDRLQACNAFGGSCCELGKASKKGCLVGIKRSFSQTQGCQLNLSLAILNTMRDIVLIVHGPVGCGASNVGVAGVTAGFKKIRDPKTKGLIWLNTNLKEADVINGGEGRLRETVLYAERTFRPAAIIVVNSCVPALIGDDLDGVLDQLQKEVSSKIVPIHCEGFKTKIMASAYDAVYHGILRKLVGEREEEKPVIQNQFEELKRQYKISRTLNLLNVSSMSYQDEVELTRLLKALDISVRILPCYSHPDDFEEVSEAALNVTICPTHDDYFVHHLKTQYNIPFVLNTIPVGIRNTNQWLRDIASFFGEEKRVEKLIAKETQELEQALVGFKKQLKGKTAFVAGGEIRILAMVELLSNLGIQVLGMKGYHYDEYADALLKEVPEGDQVIFNVATGQPFEQANLLERLKPDLYVGHTSTNSWAAKQGIPVFPLFGQAVNYLGYSGVYETARRIAKVLRNPSFNKKLAANFPLPYYDHWYKENPFSYLKDAAASEAF